MQTIAKLTCELSYSANLLPHFLVHQVDKDGAGHEHKFLNIDFEINAKAIEMLLDHNIFSRLLSRVLLETQHNKIVDKIDVLVFGRKDCFGDNDKIQNSNCTLWLLV